MSRRKFIYAGVGTIIVAIGGTALYFITNPTPVTTTTSTTSSAKPVTIEFWSPFTQTERVQALKTLFQKFESTHPNVTINMTVVGFNQLWEKWVAAFSTNNHPDIAGASVQVAIGAYNMGGIQPVNETVETIGKDKFVPIKLQSMTDKNGDIVAMPFYTHAYGILYRKDRLEEKGISPPKTWEELLAASEAVVDKDKEIYGKVQGMNKDQHWIQECYGLAVNNDISFFDEDGKPTCYTPEMIEAVKFYSQVQETSYPGSKSASYDETYAAWISGKGSMFKDDPGFNFFDFKRNKPELIPLVDMVYDPPPKSKPTNHTCLSTVQVLVLKNGANQETKDLLAFLYEPENLLEYLRTVPGGMMPVLSALVENNSIWWKMVEEAYGDNWKYVKHPIEVGIDGIQTGTPLGMKYGYEPNVGYLANFVFESGLERIAAGSSVEDAMKWVNDQFADLIARD